MVQQTGEVTGISLVGDLLTEARQLSQSGHLEASANKYLQVLALEPENPVIHFELGVVAFNRGRYPAAIGHLQKAIDLDSSQPLFHNGLGIAYTAAGDLPAGARCFERVLELAPDYAVAHYNLGNNYEDQGRLPDAADCFRHALSLNAEYVDASVRLGELLRHQGELAPAAAVYRQALAAGSDSAEIRFNLGVTLYQMGDDTEAVKMFQAVAASHPGYPGVHRNLGLALIRLDRIDEAVASYEKAIASEPGSAAAHHNLGYALLVQNDLDGAIAGFRKTLAIEPGHARAYSNLLLALNYLPNISQEELYKESSQFEAQQIGDISPCQQPFGSSSVESRRLRVGYVSPDFRTHSVALFTRKMIGAHDRGRFEVFCYADVVNPDQVTSQFREKADRWVSIVEMGDTEVADRIASDRIDILIDLAGHTGYNRLLVFARRPAPIQISWLGYPNTTGLTCIDYRLTDAIADPPGATDQWYSEKLIRLPHGFLCYQPEEPGPAIAAGPCRERGHITFGSFNLLLKITPDVVRTWATILKKIPAARLVLKSRGFASEKTRAQFLQEFGKQGVSPERLDLLCFIAGTNAHLAAYAGIDIGLDPFPYNGTTTTCEALWMGVPVVSLRGDRHAGRVGASIMHHAGLPEMVAASEDEYVEVAVSLASDRQRLVTLREELRPTMRESILMDNEQFTKSLEEAYQDMWKTWCGRQH